MDSKLKALGLALLASFVLSVAAVSVQAAEFHTTGAGVSLSGGQLTAHKFTTGGGFGTIECGIVKFTGTSTSATSSSQTIDSEHSNCLIAGSTDTVHWDDNSCDFRFIGPIAPKTTEGKVHIECNTPGDSITLEITSQHTPTTKCIVHYPAQQDLGVVTYHNGASGGRKDITVTIHLTKITSIVTGGFFNCGTTEGHKTSGTYTGSTTLTGSSGGLATDIWVE